MFQRITRYLLLGLAVLLPPLEALRAEPAGYACFPSCQPFNTTVGPVPNDGRFLSLAGAALATFDSDAITVVFGLPAAAATVDFGIFDGDTLAGSRWDSVAGAIDLTYTLYEDPLGDGLGTVQVGQWDQLDFTDDAWVDFSFPVGAGARAPSGKYFYRLVIQASNAQPQAWTNFKVRTFDTNSLTLKPQAFNFTGAIFATLDIFEIYPAFPAVAPSNYDGSWKFFARVDASTETAEFWDGDLDHGAADCTMNDTDDPDTPGAPFLPPWAAPTSAHEGVAVGDVRPCGTLTGFPADDIDFNYFARSPAVEYAVEDPAGNLFTNSNPSGNLEWERFTLTTNPAVPADALTTSLPAGIYQIHMTGMDMSNFNSWFIPVDVEGVCQEGGDVSPPSFYHCVPNFSPFLIGDFVWEDLDGDGVQDGGEPGIAGVVMELLDPRGSLLQTATTNAAGLYGFEVEKGSYTVRVAASNFGPGGALQGLASTTGGETRSNTVVAQNVLTYDYGYRRLAGSIGDRVWHDLDSDGVQDGSEAGLNGVTVRLETSGGTLVSSAVTAGNGNYLFTGVAPGSYRVVVVSSTVPSGFVPTFDLDGVATAHAAAVSLAAGQNRTDVDFGYVAPTCTAGYFLDSFSSASLSNNNGTISWAGSWEESDVAGAGPSVGNVRVSNGTLTLQDAPDTGGQPSAARMANLSLASSATLSFTYSTTSSVDPDDAVVVEISRDGGATYTVLETFTGIDCAVTVNRSYNISAYLSSQTKVRFRVKNNYGVSDEKFSVDNFKISTTCPSSCTAATWLDNFGTVSFSNNDGSVNFSSAWQESDVAGSGPSAGNIRVKNGFLTLQDSPDTGTQPNAARTANLSGASSATLSFTFKTSSTVDADDAVVVEISRDGGATYTVLETFTGICGSTSATRNYNISAYISGQTKVRFRVKSYYGVCDEYFYVDKFKIMTTCPS